jgi:dGTPase
MSEKRNVRLHSAESYAGNRSEFRRDRDSIFYSNFFRRLAGVTQVVHAAEGHVFHNRLIHSLKVAQIGQSIVDEVTCPKRAKKRTTKKIKDIIHAVGGVDVDVVQTACLAHDLGHPPFGHITESELDKCAIENEVPDGFEGNPQSFRIVTQVAVHDAAHPGLNLTSASLNALLKYPWKRDVEGDKHKKWGRYFDDKRSFDLARSRETHPEQRSAEAEIMDWADDVAYCIHDVDDFYRAGVIPLDRILAGRVEKPIFLKDVKHAGRIDNHEAANRIFKFIRKEVGRDLLVPFQGTTAQYRALRLFETKLIQRFLAISKPNDLYLDPDGESRLHVAPALRAEVNILKGLMRYYVYEAPALVAQQFGQRKLVRELFEILLDAAYRPASKGIIPPPFDEQLKNADTPTKKVRLAMDVIASLTEQQAVTYHARLVGNSLGFFADRIFGA